MDISDQVAIHEAMEQQTISIAKAGIQATLNARTSVLAAANPIGGRYDRKKTLRQNISMTAPIMSRFDLFFVVVDECDERADYNIARHILGIHRYGDEAVEPPVSPALMQRYIRYARLLKPKITREAADLLVSNYKQLRQSDVSGTGSSYRMTVRQLESMVRLSEALARVYGNGEVVVEYVRDAGRLLKSSVIRVESENIDLDASERDWSGKKANVDMDEAKDKENIELNVNQKITLKYEEYARISNMLVFKLRQYEHETEADSTAIQGLIKSELVNWYLEQIEPEIENESQYNEKKRKVRVVIDRLVHKDMVLIELKKNDDDGDPVLVVHPNYSS